MPPLRARGHFLFVPFHELFMAHLPEQLGFVFACPQAHERAV